ncbi:MAG: hypothetical protein IPH00_16490 [Flavobacteriales bacterium]|nr:hypothetical protein [Flavobacteriales bacterium]MBK7247254.1 hypothetical protein [Flavobacteriales bacterium]HQY04108.1 hypothetical protein [Flavobacteriales bacterium]
MDRFTPRSGTGRFAFQHTDFMQDAAQKALANAFADYIAVTDSFYVQGGEITEVVAGTGMNYTITDGVVCLAGEFMPLVGSTVLKSASQVVFLSVQDTGIDTYPTPNTDGQVDHVMRERKAVMQVGVAFPTGSFSLNLQRKSTIDMLRLKGRVVPKGGILPYFGTMAGFDATGLGISGTPSEGWAVCNGMNGTLDMRGMVPMGATNVPSSGAGSLFAGVGAPSDAGEATGADGVQIAANNLPAHTHPYNDRTRNYNGSGSGVSGGSSLDYTPVDDIRTSQPNATTNDPVSVRQASRSLVFIQSIV